MICNCFVLCLSGLTGVVIGTAEVKKKKVESAKLKTELILTLRKQSLSGDYYQRMENADVIKFKVLNHNFFFSECITALRKS